MLDELLSIIQSKGQQEVVDNPNVPNEYNMQVMSTAGSSIFDGLRDILAGGGLGQIMNLFGAGARSNEQGLQIQSLLQNPVVQNLVQSFVGRVTNQFNIQPAAARQLGNNLIPQVLGGLIQRLNDPGHAGLDMNSLLSSLTGGQTAGMDFNPVYNRVSQSGMDLDGDGDVDLKDMASMVSRVAGNASTTEGPNIMDAIVGFFGK